MQTVYIYQFYLKIGQPACTSITPYTVKAIRCCRVDICQNAVLFFRGKPSFAGGLADRFTE